MVFATVIEDFTKEHGEQRSTIYEHSSLIVSHDVAFGSRIPSCNIKYYHHTVRKAPTGSVVQPMGHIMLCNSLRETLRKNPNIFTAFLQWISMAFTCFYQKKMKKFKKQRQNDGFQLSKCWVYHAAKNDARFIIIIIPVALNFEAPSTPNYTKHLGLRQRELFWSEMPGFINKNGDFMGIIWRYNEDNAIHNQQYDMDQYISIRINMYKYN